MYALDQTQFEKLKQLPFHGLMNALEELEYMKSRILLWSLQFVWNGSQIWPVVIANNT